MVVPAGGYEDLDGPIYLDPNNPNHQAAIEQLRATREPAVPYSVGGIGTMRDIGDPNDPRRGGSAPQQAPVPGLPAPQPFSGYEVLPGESARSNGSSNVPPYRDAGLDLPRKGWGAGGGMQVTPPQGRSGQGRKMLYGENGESIPTEASRGAKAPYFTNYQRSRSAPPAVDRSKVAKPEPEMPALREQSSQFTQQGPTPQLSEQDLDAVEAMLGEYLGGSGTSVNETDVVQTADGRKPKGRLSQDDLTPHSRGSFIDPSLASTPEISPYSAIQVPVRGRDGQVNETRTIDPQGTFVTREGDLDATHSSETTDEVSVARRASELKQGARTPMISGTDLNELAASGQARRPTAQEEDRNLAGFITRGGEEVPVYRTTSVKDTGNGPVALYRVGAPNNTNWNQMRDEANPRYKEESGPFDTQVVRQPKSRAGLRRDIGDLIAGAQSKGSSVYAVDPVSGRRVEVASEGDLNTGDFYIENTDRGQKSHFLVERGEPEVTMGRITEQGEPTGRAILASGSGRPDERVTETGPVPFLNRDDVYAKVGGIRKNVERQVARDDRFQNAVTRLDDVMGGLAESGFMESPDTVNVSRKMASAVLQGQMDPDAVPASIRGEVAAELRAMQGQGREVILTQEPATTGEVEVDRVAATAAEARGPVKAFIDRPQASMAADSEELGGFVGQDRNTDGQGELVQGAYGDFGENRGDDAGFNRGFSTKSAAIFETPEREAQIAAVKQAIAAKLGLPESRSMAQQVEALTPLVMRNMDQGDSFDSAISQFTGGPVETIQGPTQGPRRQAPYSQLAVAEAVNAQAVAEESSGIPQRAQSGVVNTEQVSQINAPAPAGQMVDPTIGAQIDNNQFLQQNVNSGNIRQTAADNITAGLAPGASPARQNAAQQLLAQFRRRFG